MIKFHESLIERKKNLKNEEWVVALENPISENEITFGGLQSQLVDLSGSKLEDLSFYLLRDTKKVEELKNAETNLKDKKFSSGIIYVCPKSFDVSKSVFPHAVLKPENFPDQP